MTMKWMMVPLCAAALAWGPGCSRPAEHATTEQGVQAERREYREKLQARYNDVSAKIDELQAKLEAQGKVARKETKDAIDELKDQRDDLRDNMKKVEDTSEEKWSEFRAKLDGAMADLERGYNRTLDAMKTN